MPIIAVNNRTSLIGSDYYVAPLSTWTVERIISEALILTNQHENQEVNISNLRNHYNVSISHLAKLLNLNSAPWYAINIMAILESKAHASGLDWIDLSSLNTYTPPDNGKNGTTNPWGTAELTLPSSNTASAGPQGINLSNKLSQINRIQVTYQYKYNDADENWEVQKYVPADATNLLKPDFIGNLTRWDVARLTHQNNQLNSQHGQTIAWGHQGNAIFFYIGKDIYSPSKNLTEGWNTLANRAEDIYANSYYDVSSQTFMIWAYRQPKLDDLLPFYTSSTWNGNADIPDEYVKLLVDLLRKHIYLQLNQPVPGEVEQNINTALQQLSQNLQQDAAMELAALQQTKQGYPGKSPGAKA